MLSWLLEKVLWIVGIASQVAMSANQRSEWRNSIDERHEIMLQIDRKFETEEYRTKNPLQRSIHHDLERKLQ